MKTYYSDYHIHTQLSSDSSATLDEIAKVAVSRGLGEICTTDHWNLLDQGAVPLEKSYPWHRTEAMILEARETWWNQLDIRMGLEIGNAVADMAAVEAGIHYPGVDFLIGSIHNMSLKEGGLGIYTEAVRCKTQADVDRVMQDYYETLEEMVASNTYDVVGHIPYPLRYFPKHFQVKLMNYRDPLASVLKHIIARGKGIEFNTSPLLPMDAWQDLFLLYHDLGGEFITTGSDSHANATIGSGIREAVQLLKACGFRHLTTYRQHTPFQSRIG